MRFFPPFTAEAQQALIALLVTPDGNHQGDVCPGKKARGVSGGGMNHRKSRRSLKCIA